MNIKKIIMVGLVAAASLALGEVAVTGVTAKQRYPWNGLVDITVTLSGTEEECKDETLTIPLYATNKTTHVELPVRTVMANGVVSGEGNQWTRKLIWNATADVGCAKFGEVELTTGTPVTGGVQLWENGPYWAEYNVGATKPEEYGYYFWWGDTVGYKRNENNDGWVSVKDGSSFSFSSENCPTCGKDSSELQSAGCIDSTGNLVAKYDAATAHLGAPWRMPTGAEFSALIDNCTITAVWRNGVAGRLFTGRNSYSSKSIFLPEAGYGNYSNLYENEIGGSLAGEYWTSTRCTHNYNNSDYALRLRIFGGRIYLIDDYERNRGMSVRPVRGFAQ